MWGCSLHCFDKNGRGSDYGVPLVSTLFIVVKEGGRFDFVAEYDPKCLIKKHVLALASTYNYSEQLKEIH